MNVILTMSSFIFPLITFPYVSRILLPEGTGKVSFATSLISYFSMFAQLGIPTYGIRACAKVRDDKEELTRTTQALSSLNLGTSIKATANTVYEITLITKLIITSSCVVLVNSSLSSRTFAQARMPYVGSILITSKREIEAKGVV